MIKHKNMLLIAALAVCVQGFGGCVQRSGKADGGNVIAHWSFDDVDNNKIKDKTGRHDGMAKGDVPTKFLKDGLYGKAAYFNKGRCSVNVSHSDDLSLIDDFTIECVIMPFAVDSFRTIIWKGNRKVLPEAINYFVDIRKGKVELKTKNKDGKWCVYSTRPVLEKNKWYDIVITYKGGDVTIYVNGDLKASKISESNPSGTSLLANKYDINIGAGADHIESNYSFDGLIDEIKISKGTSPDISKKRQNDFARRQIEYRCKELEKKALEVVQAAQRLSEAAIADGGLASGDLQNKKALLKELDEVCAKESDTQNFALKKLNRQTNAYQYKKFFALKAGANAPFALTVMPASERLVKKARFFDDLKSTSNAISIEMARNEREGFQVFVLGNPFKNIKNVKVSIGDLKHENGKDSITSKNIEWAPVASVETTPPEIAVDFVGKIPDIIMEGGEKLNVSQNDFTPVFFRIFVGKNVVSGNYDGIIKFAKDGHAKKISVKLKVYDFVLPEKNSLIVAFSFFEQFYKKWYGYKNLTDKQKMNIYNFLLKYRIPPNNIYSREGCFPNIKYLKKLASKGGNFCTLKTLSGKKLRSEKDVDKILEDYRQNIKALKADGLFKYAYWYGYDELGCHLSMMPSAKQIMPKILAEFPDLKLMQTSFPTQNIAHLFNVWVPSFAYFTSEKNLKILDDARKKPNAEIWWYNAGAPKKPFPNYFLDYPVFDCRIIMTMSYMYKVKGILYWSINREWTTNNLNGRKWPDVPWKPYIYGAHTKKRVYKNGMGNFTYPGLGGKIYPSLRLENFRDGIEDYEYLKLLENGIAELKKNSASSGLVGDAEKLLKVPAKVAAAVNNFSSNPKYLLEYRKNVANMIVKVQAELERAKK